jgi:DNA-binding transcriptional LysR family regulator
VIDKLNYVLALAREQHFGRAALACGVTQPTMSAGLKQLEDTLGIVIVRRSSRFQGFTPEGEHVLSWARRIVSDAQAMRQDLDALKRGLAGHLRIAVIPTALTRIPSLTTPLRDHHPAVRLSITSNSSIEILNRLNNLDVEAGITYLDNEPLGDVKTVPLYHESYRLLVSADNPLGEREQVTWQEIGDLPLCLLTPDMQNRRIIDQMLRDAGARPDAALESNSVMLLVAHVATSRWSSVVAASLVEDLSLATIRAIPIVSPQVTHLVGLVVPQRYAISPLTNALVREAERMAVRLGPVLPAAAAQ